MAKPELARGTSRFAEAAELGPHSRSGSSEFHPGAWEANAPDLGCARLFSDSREPVLIVDAARWIIVHANASAVRLIGTSKAALIGAPLQNFLRAGCGPDVRSSLTNARAEGSGRLTDVRVVATGTALNATVSLVKSAGREYLLLHPRPIVDSSAEKELVSFVSEAIDNAPMGFLVTDDRLRVLYANRALLRIAGLSSADEVIGFPMTRWLELSPANLSRLGDQMASRESVTGLVTRLNGDSGPSRLVHVLAIAVPDGAHSRWGFTVTEHASIN